MEDLAQHPWIGLRKSARALLETRDYSAAPLKQRITRDGAAASELIAGSAGLEAEWIPGVELIPRRVFQQKARGYFAELARLDEGRLAEIGLVPRQWASALMHRDSAKGFHVHPPHIPAGKVPAEWFHELFAGNEHDYSKRPYHLEQWDLMFFLTGLCEMLLVDERDGLARKTMRFTITGDNMPGPDNVAVVIPPGVAHALRSIGHEDMIMVYGTTTTFNQHWEGRIASSVEKAPLPVEWQDYLNWS